MVEKLFQQPHGHAGGGGGESPRATERNDRSGLVVLGELQFQAGELDAAKANRTTASQLFQPAPRPAPRSLAFTAADLKFFWRSDHYSALSKGVLSGPACKIETP